MNIQGVWLPVITPFRDDRIDLDSLGRLVEHYIGHGIHGLIVLGTTGESPAVSEKEAAEIIDKTLEYAGGRVPVFAGIGGNYTDRVVKLIKAAAGTGIGGILSVSPYYNRPDQRGIYNHFLKISESTDLPIIIYNIPYRTGRNIENDTIRRLAGLKNIVGLKDASGDIRQSMELLLHRPDDFSIMTGEDILFYPTLCLGGDGGIMASAHLMTEHFVALYEKISTNDHRAALDDWRKAADMIPLLFAEPSPGPIKYCLHRMGLIDSPETRLPITAVSTELEKKLEHLSA